MNKRLQVKCPQCDKVFSYYESDFRPFCCERCKMIDLGHWFEESYRVPDKEKNQTDQNNEDNQGENQKEKQNEIQDEDDENNY